MTADHTVLSDPFPRSQTPPRRPARRWIPTRLCRCGGDCRFRPASQPCPGGGATVQLYVTEGR